MREPSVTVVEDPSGIAFLMLGFEDGESRTAMFFAEPETAQEAADQVPWRMLRVFMGEFRRECDDGACDGCEECRWIRRFTWTTIIVFAMTLLWPTLGFFLMAVLAGGVQYFVRWWAEGTPKREEQKRQRAWLGPAIKSIRPFEMANDFRGGLNKALELCRA